MPCREIVVDQPFDTLLEYCQACLYVVTGDDRARLCAGATVYDAARLIEEYRVRERTKDAP
ncbi:hypothetical protein GQ85_24385 [Rhodococcus rhodochrous]|nr:hypothetical protein GQ85_24385 [Rhodococcus rhodochrous]